MSNLDEEIKRQREAIIQMDNQYKNSTLKILKEINDLEKYLHNLKQSKIHKSQNMQLQPHKKTTKS